MFSKSCLLNKSSSAGSKKPGEQEETSVQVHSVVRTVSRCSEHSSGQERRAMSMAGTHWRKRAMKYTTKLMFAACGAVAAALGIGTATTPAQAQAKTITLCWAAWDPANALVELSKAF